MKVDKVRFSYRGAKSGGHILAELLSDISVDYESNSGRVSGSADLGAFLRDGLLEQKPPALAIETPVPTVTVMDRYVRQWLTAMNVPLNKTTTLRFVFADDLSSEDISLDREPAKYKIEFRDLHGSWERSALYRGLYSETEATRLINASNSDGPAGWQRRKVKV